MDDQFIGPRRYVPTSDAQALHVACPRCGSDVGEPCVRVWVQSYGGTVTWPSLYANRAAGEPIGRPHNERREAFRDHTAGWA